MFSPCIANLVEILEFQSDLKGLFSSLEKVNYWVLEIVVVLLNSF